VDGDNREETPTGLIGPRGINGAEGLVVTVKFGSHQSGDIHEPLQLELSFTLNTCTFYQHFNSILLFYF